MAILKWLNPIYELDLDLASENGVKNAINIRALMQQSVRSRTRKFCITPK